MLPFLYFGSFQRVCTRRSPSPWREGSPEEKLLFQEWCCQDFSLETHGAPVPRPAKEGHATNTGTASPDEDGVHQTSVRRRRKSRSRETTMGIQAYSELQQSSPSR